MPRVSLLPTAVGYLAAAGLVASIMFVQVCAWAGEIQCLRKLGWMRHLR